MAITPEAEVMRGLYTAIREVDNGLTVGQSTLERVPMEDLEQLSNSLRYLADRVQSLWRERRYPPTHYPTPSTVITAERRAMRS
jgi:hypothetical protein